MAHWPALIFLLPYVLGAALLLGALVWAMQ
jgi:hypothetical protein